MHAGLKSSTVVHAAAFAWSRIDTRSHAFLSSSRQHATAANVEAHMEPLYIALWRKQPSERAHACSDTLHARRGRRLKLLGWLESRPWGRLRHRWPWTMEKPRRRTSAMLDMPEAQPRPCVACSRVVPRVAGYRVRLHHTDTRVTHKHPYPLFTLPPRRAPRALRHVGRPPASAPRVLQLKMI